MSNDLLQDDEIIRQDNERGPGWFLILSYIIISLFCLYYYFEYRDWKSSYQIQQEQIDAKIGK
ncbi:MAG TPA: hypothetical protein VMW43_03565 [Bacteroidota bacterium]|nr:hypothetical protein [Bacteroidota bacterium]